MREQAGALTGGGPTLEWWWLTWQLPARRGLRHHVITGRLDHCGTRRQPAAARCSSVEQCIGAEGTSCKPWCWYTLALQDAWAGARCALCPLSTTTKLSGSRAEPSLYSATGLPLPTAAHHLVTLRQAALVLHLTHQLPRQQLLMTPHRLVWPGKWGASQHHVQCRCISAGQWYCPCRQPLFGTTTHMLQHDSAAACTGRLPYYSSATVRHDPGLALDKLTGHYRTMPVHSLHNRQGGPARQPNSNIRAAAQQLSSSGSSISSSNSSSS
jgi:hypothetical protein